MTCNLASELDLVMALRRRALAFDLIGVASFKIVNKYHQALAQRLQEASPPGYAKVCIQQVIRADRAAFLRMAGLTSTVKRNASGSLPLDTLLKDVIIDPAVAYHLEAHASCLRFGWQ